MSRPYTPLRPDPRNRDEVRRWVQDELDRLADVLAKMSDQIEALEARVTALEP